MPQQTFPESTRVLVVELDPPVRRTISRMVSRMGAQVTEASDGPPGLLAVEEEALHVVLLGSMTMRDHEFLERMRILRPELPAIILALSANTDRGRALSQGWLDKPFTYAALLDALLTVVPEARTGSDRGGSRPE